MKKLVFAGMTIGSVLSILLMVVAESSGIRPRARTEIQRTVTSTQARMIPSPPPTKVSWKQPKGRNATELANDFIEKNKKQLGIQDHHELRPFVFRSPIRTTVKYTFYEGGLPLVGLELKVQFNRNLDLINVISDYRPLEPADLSLLGNVTPEEVSRKIEPRYRIDRDSLRNSEPILFATTNAARPELSYVVRVRDRARFGGNRFSIKNIVVRASDGQVLRTQFPRREFSYHAPHEEDGE